MLNPEKRDFYMENGWIKLHRKTLANGILRDQTAWVIFSWLLLKVDRKTGKKTVGRFWASGELGMKPTTFYQGLKRLEKKWKVLTLNADNEKTEVSLINWHKYQSNDKANDNQMTTNRQRNDTLQEVKNIRIKKITNVIVKPRNEDIDISSKYFLEEMKIPKEDCTQRQSRQYWQLLLRESKTGLDGVKWLIQLASKDEFLAPNITSSKDLYYKRIKLISRARGSMKPKIAVFGGDAK